MVRERLETPDIDSPKNPDLNRKSQVDTKLSESFYYLPYLDICNHKTC